MKNALIGHTGFVGSNLLAETKFERTFNSKTINCLGDDEYDTIVCAAPSAVKWQANREPQADLDKTNAFIETLKHARAKRFVHISTVDVYRNPAGVNESTPIDPEATDPYGRHRYYLETFVRKHFTNRLIVRLPALFGRGLKKNFIYDMTHKQPKFIPEEKFNALVASMEPGEKEAITKYYALSNGNYALTPSFSKRDALLLDPILERYHFTSLMFTHNESAFQFYDLRRLWNDIERALDNGIETLNISSEPLRAKEIAKEAFEYDFETVTSSPPVYYDMRSEYAHLWNGTNGYLYSKKETLDDIKRFVENENK